MENPVLVQRDGAIATVVLNRPEKLNAINLAMWEELAETFTALNDEEWVRCIVLRGAGTKARPAEVGAVLNLLADAARDDGQLVGVVLIERDAVGLKDAR